MPSLVKMAGGENLYVTLDCKALDLKKCYSGALMHPEDAEHVKRRLGKRNATLRVLHS